MSYCRMGWGGSDLYMFENVAGHVECCGCRFDDPWIVHLNSLDEALAHVARHREAGHGVPLGLEGDIIRMNPWTDD